MLTIEEHENSNEDKGNPIKAATGNGGEGVPQQGRTALTSSEQLKAQ